MYAPLIFFLALVVRCIIGYIFYGSIDVSAFISINEHTLNHTLVHHPFTIWCAFPIIPFYLWFSGFLAIKTQLPLAFCFKCIPIIFDSLLAVLIYEFVQNMRQKQAFACGLLYALSPIAIMITCIHGQWDAMPIFFLLWGLFIRDFYRNTVVKYFLYGALFAFSFLLKPIALVFIPFFFVPWPSLKQTLGRYWTYLLIILGLKIVTLISFFAFFKMQKNYAMDTFFALVMSSFSPVMIIGIACIMLLIIGSIVTSKPWQHFPLSFQHYLSYQCAALLGLSAMIIISFICLYMYGFNLIRVIDKILRYFNQGIAVFGLPFGYPFNQGLLYLILRNRFWIMGLIGIIAVLYYKTKIDIYQGILAGLMIIFSFSGLSPQYLMWAVPFLLITGLYQAAVFFNAISLIFFVLYYMNPFSNAEIPYQSMLSFAPLKSFSWLLPPLFLTDVSLLRLVHLIGNYVLPIVCFSIAAILLMRVYRSTAISQIMLFENISIGWQMVYGIFCLGLTGLIATLMICVEQNGFDILFKQTIATKMLWYDVYHVNGFLSGRYGVLNPCNIVFIFLALTLWWCLYAWIIARKHKL